MSATSTCVLSAEVEEREHRAVQRRLKEAQLPRAKTLEEFDFSQSPKVSARRIRELAEGDYIDQARPVLFLGDAGTGKTHLATALCVAACQQRRRVRFTTGLDDSSTNLSKLGRSTNSRA